MSGEICRDFIQSCGAVDGESERIAGADQRQALQSCRLLQGLLAFVLAWHLRSLGRRTSDSTQVIMMRIGRARKPILLREKSYGSRSTGWDRGVHFDLAQDRTVQSRRLMGFTPYRT